MAERGIAEYLLHISQMIESDQLNAASDLIQSITLQHPEWIDERFQAELQLIMKQMEYKIALKDFSYLRGLALVYRYCEINYVHADLEQTVSAVVRSNRSTDDGLLPERDTVWWCWLQGLENAPDIVRRCYQSLQKLGKKIVVLDERNISEYIQLPIYITEKYQKGMISKAHYTDLVRLELLTGRGGTWIDATAWISGTDRLLPLLEEEDIFMFRAGNVSEHIIFDNWFMHARKSSSILEATKELLYAYWLRETEARHYFIFHLMMTLACRCFQEEYAKIPVFSNEPCHVLQYELFHPYKQKRWGQIKEMSDVHKLTYKIENDIESALRKDTFWHFILEGTI